MTTFGTNFTYKPFGTTTPWWSSLPVDSKQAIIAWIDRTATAGSVPIDLARMWTDALTYLHAHGVTGDPTDAQLTGRVLVALAESGYARDIADGGGFIVIDSRGITHCLCQGTSPGAVSVSVNDAHCPPGTGGVPLVPFTTTTTMTTHTVTKTLPGLTAEVGGTVLRPDGTPAAGAAIAVAPSGGGMTTMGTTGSTITGSDGTFVVKNLTPTSLGMVDITITLFGYADQKITATITKGTSIDVGTVMLVTKAGEGAGAGEAATSNAPLIIGGAVAAALVAYLILS